MGEDAARLASRLVCFGFDGYKPDDHAREMIAKGCGACIIFDRNIRDPEQVATLCADLKRLASPRPLLVMIDQEGGRVRRFRPPHFADIPAAAAIG
jgi:beta-N-acetylhexosaminidase